MSDDDLIRIRHDCGGWVTVKTRLLQDLKTREIVPGQRCPHCRKEIKP